MFVENVILHELCNSLRRLRTSHFFRHPFATTPTMLQLRVSHTMPWTIGRALAFIKTHQVFLIVDETANARFRTWIEKLKDVSGSMMHSEQVFWSPCSHKKLFRGWEPILRLVLLSQLRQNTLFGRLPRELIVEELFTKISRKQNVRHVRYEIINEDWNDSVDDEYVSKWNNKFFEYWLKQIKCGRWEGVEFAEMGVTVCGDPAEDSVCCEDLDCEACEAFREAAANRALYDI